MQVSNNPANGSNDSLAQSALLGTLNAESLEALANRVQTVELGKGEVLFMQNDAGDALYIVESGSVEISVYGENGKKLSLNVMRPPDVFGEIAALDGGRRTATATTLEPARLLKLDRRRILETLKVRPEVAADMIQILCERLRWVSQQVEDMGILAIEGRLANRLLILHHRFADSSGCLCLSQSDLADFLGVTRESINKVLQEWRACGLIELSRGAVRVRDEESLAEIAGQH